MGKWGNLHAIYCQDHVERWLETIHRPPRKCTVTACSSGLE